MHLHLTMTFDTDKGITIMFPKKSCGWNFPSVKLELRVLDMGHPYKFFSKHLGLEMTCIVFSNDIVRNIALVDELVGCSSLLQRSHYVEMSK